MLQGGRLGLIDFEATGRLDALQQASMREMLVAVQQRDAGLLRQAVLEVATLRRRFDDEQLERALARFMAKHLGASAAPSAAMFNDLLQLIFTFGITLPPEFSTFFRALVTLEGTLTMLSPGYLVIEAAEQLAAEWAKASLAPGSAEELVRRELASLALLLRRTPRHLERIATMIERGDLRARVSLLADEQDARAVARLVNRAVLALLGGVVGVLSVMLLGTQGGPRSPATPLCSTFRRFAAIQLMAAQGFPEYRDRYSSVSSGLPVLAGDDVGGLGGQLRLGRVGNAGGPVGVGGVEGLGPEQGLDQGVEPVPVGP